MALIRHENFADTGVLHDDKYPHRKNTPEYFSNGIPVAPCLIAKYHEWSPLIFTPSFASSLSHGYNGILANNKTNAGQRAGKIAHIKSIQDSN